MARGREVSTQQKNLSYDTYAKVQTPEESPKSFPLCIKLRCSEFSPVQKVLITFPIIELHEVQEIWKSIQTSACVSDSISPGSRKHDFPLPEDYHCISNTETTISLLSLSLACWATLGTSLHGAQFLYGDIHFFCEAHCMKWFQRSAPYHCFWLGRTGGGGEQVTGLFFRNSAVAAQDSSNYCPVFSTPFLNKCCYWAGQGSARDTRGWTTEQHHSLMKVTFLCLQYWFSAVSCQVLPPPISDMRQLSRITTCAPTPIRPADWEGKTGLSS